MERGRHPLPALLLVLGSLVLPQGVQRGHGVEPGERDVEGCDAVRLGLLLGGVGSAVVGVLGLLDGQRTERGPGLPGGRVQQRDVRDLVGEHRSELVVILWRNHSTEQAVEHDDHASAEGEGVHPIDREEVSLPGELLAMGHGHELVEDRPNLREPLAGRVDGDPVRSSRSFDLRPGLLRLGDLLRLRDDVEDRGAVDGVRGATAVEVS